MVLDCKNSELPCLYDSESLGGYWQEKVVSGSPQNSIVDLRNYSNQSQMFGINKSVNFLGYALCTIELYKAVKNYISYKRWLKHLSYCEFMTSFAYLLTVEEQIAYIQDFLHKNSYGTFPEKVAARINLVRLSLAKPYDKIINECAQSYFKANFDDLGRLVWHECDDIDLHYKKFYKKVPQDFRDLARCSKKISKSSKYVYASGIAGKTENAYNQTLLDIIYAGIDENFPLLKKLCRSYYDALFEKLYRYYIEQKQIRHRMLGEINDSDFAVNDIANIMFVRREQNISEEEMLQEWYGREMTNWLCSHQQDNVLLQNVMYFILPDEQILELPFNSNYRFILLRSLLDKVCLGSQDRLDVSQELFSSHGVLKKYENHEWLQNKIDNIFLDDAIMQKVVNFVLAICEKEDDEVTQKIGKRLLQYVFCAYNSTDSKTFAYYKNKIVVLYEALSYKRYDLNILVI